MNQNFYAECRNHDIVVKPGINTDVLVKHGDYIEVTANDKLKFYGTQFHPELKKINLPYTFKLYSRYLYVCVN